MIDNDADRNLTPGEIFRTALVIAEGSKREDYLEEKCGTNSSLRRRVEALLDAHALSGDCAQTIAGDAKSFSGKDNPAPSKQGNQQEKIKVAALPRPGEKAGDLVDNGKYKILQEIGEGGFGVVYMAEQQRPVKRKVALKVVKPGMDSREVVARFEAERQALALMDHPNIARVLDGGTTDAGRPFFAMELVRGIPFTQYCDAEKLSIHKRLELFRDVCAAVQHAHHKAIIHRDMKPSNILVTMHDTKPVIKVIDFGIAKALGQELTEKTLFTAYGGMVGTPAYMSPEQAEFSGLDVDTRADIYSLGVVLYELLTGFTPIEARTLLDAGYEGMVRMIQESDAPRPSTRLKSYVGEAADDFAIRHAGETPERIGRLMKGDLDWIILKCLEKDRNRRYETANALSQDVRRHLEDEPVLAGPPSARYKFSKFVRRNKIRVVVGTGMLALLLGGLGATAWQMIRAQRAEKLASSRLVVVEEEKEKSLAAQKEAETEAERAKKVTEFLATVIGEAGLKDRGKDVTLIEALDAAIPKIESQFVDDVEIRAALLDAVVRSYQALGQPAKMAPLLEKAIDASTLAHGAAALRTLELRVEQLKVLKDLGQLNQVIKVGSLLLSDLTSARIHETPQKWRVATTYEPLIEACILTRNLEKADFYVTGFLSFTKAHYGENSVIRQSSLGSLGKLEAARGNFDKTLEIRQQIVSDLDKIDFTEGSGWRAGAYRDLGNALRNNGRAREAVDAFRIALAELESDFSSEHIQSRVVRTTLAWALYESGEREEPFALLKENLELVEIHQPDDPVAMNTALTGVASIYLAMGQQEQSLVYAERRIPFVSKIYGAQSTEMVSALLGVAKSQFAGGQLSKSESTLQRAFEIAEEAVPRKTLLWFQLYEAKLNLNLRQENLGDARRLLEEVTKIGDVILSAEGPGRASISKMSGDLERLEGNFALAADHYKSYLVANAGPWTVNRISVAACLAISEDRAGHQAFTKRLLNELPANADAEMSEAVARCILLAPWISQDPDLLNHAGKQAKLALEKDPGSAWPPLLLGVHGIYSGNLEEAGSFLDLAISTATENDSYKNHWCPILARTVKLLAPNHGLSETERSEVITRARKMCQTNPGSPWYDRIFLYLLLKELGEADGISETPVSAD